MAKLEKRFPLYSKFLKLYPPEYRQRYSTEMLQTLADMLDDKKNTRSSVWLRTIADLPFSLIKENAVYMGSIMTHETPNYIKKSSLIGSILLLPFFVFIGLNSLMAYRLNNVWLEKSWATAALTIFIVVMPATAFIITTGAFLRWTIERKNQTQIGFWRNLLDWRRNWPMLAVAVMSFGIIVLVFGHDSVHCVTHNPINEIRDWQNTWQCIKAG